MTENTIQSLPETGFIRVKDVLKLVPFSHTTLWRKSKNGEFPPAIRLGCRITAFRAEQVREWIESQTEKAA